MILTLEVCPPQAATLGDGSRHVFSSQGGTIGRGASCSWVLSHRKVSGRHATISYQDSIFYIVDEQSANGVFLNSTKNRLVPGRRYALKNGDRIIIDPYEMEVTIASDRDSARRPSDSSSEARGSWMSAYNPFDEGDPFAAPPPRTPGPMAAPTPKPHQAGEVVPLEELDPLKLLEGSPASKTPVRQGPSARDLDAASPMSGHYKPPAVLTPPPATPPPAAVPPSSPAFIPADYDPLRDDFDEPIVAPPPAPPTPKPSVAPEPPVARAPAAPTPPPLPTPPPRPATPPAQPADASPPENVDAPASPVRKTPRPETAPDQADPGLVAVLAGAGLERAPVTVEFARSFGQIFRVVVTGVMDVLRARQHIKDEFRMKMTQFRPADNNPLKFSANVDDALHNLLVKRNAAYLEPVEAFEDAFDDLRDHQMAMLAGMRVAFEAMLGEFNPDALQKEFDRQVKRSSLLGVTARMRYWDLYRERQEAMAKDPEATFRRLFGEEFARAYDEQLKRLKAERRARAAGPRPSDA